jgi:hypothetical protein
METSQGSFREAPPHALLGMLGTLRRSLAVRSPSVAERPEVPDSAVRRRLGPNPDPKPLTVTRNR